MLKNPLGFSEKFGCDPLFMYLFVGAFVKLKKSSIKIKKGHSRPLLSVL